MPWPSPAGATWSSPTSRRSEGRRRSSICGTSCIRCGTETTSRAMASASSWQSGGTWAERRVARSTFETAQRAHFLQHYLAKKRVRHRSPHRQDEQAVLRVSAEPRGLPGEAGPGRDQRRARSPRLLVADRPDHVQPRCAPGREDRGDQAEERGPRCRPPPSSERAAGTRPPGCPHERPLQQRVPEARCRRRSRAAPRSGRSPGSRRRSSAGPASERRRARAGRRSRGCARSPTWSAC